MQAADHSEDASAVAIIGIGCRFPGDANDHASYWQLLKSGGDAIRQTPADRWSLQKFYSPDSTKPGKTQSQWGGYVDGIDQFDPQLFGISPREASSMDPQQRMLLEVTWRALEDAGLPVEKVAGRDVSVFVGISSFDYAVAGLSFQDRSVIGPYSNTGGSSSIAANRISYCFDLHGPSVAVDTACSSSLVAVHMACESLRRGDAEMALAGGVNALLMPDFYVAFSQLGVLSPDGRCKTFDADANGYVRSEGAGMILLKPLGKAVRDGDTIYSVIRATALNQDGRTNGMTVPSQTAQASLIRKACEIANIDPAKIDYVEAHGTGTAVGDPIEAAALSSVVCENRKSDNPCTIGSVKTNIGHLEAGAGIASVIKVALALHHKQIPAHLHFRNPNPQIDLDELKLSIPRETKPWTTNHDCRTAGINGFGYGGANAHVVMQEAPSAKNTNKPRTLGLFDARSRTSTTSSKNANQTHFLLPISARSKQALTAVAGGLADWLEQNQSVSLASVAGHAAHHRSHQECRAVVVGTNHDQWISQLRSIVANPDSNFAKPLSASQADKGVLFVCSGQGPQWWAMGRQLYKTNPIFRESIDRCDREFAKYVTWSLRDELHRDQQDSRMQQTRIAQPSIFALQVSLAAVWENLGIRPRGIVGHSVGEIAAAYLSGSLNWQDACCVAIHRGRTMDLASSRGAMIAAGLSPEEALQWIDGMEGDVSLAAINGPTSVTISGKDDVIESLADRLDAANIFCRRLTVEYAFHSPQMEPVRDELLRSLANIQPRKNHTTLISTVTGECINGSELGASYWWRNVRQSVRFADAMQVSSDAGLSIALEIGPHPVLTYAITECYQQHNRPIRVFPSLHRDRDDARCIADSLSSLYTVGLGLDWSRICDLPTERVNLPLYPFQKQTCWSESGESKRTRLSQSHPLLGESTDGVLPGWRSRVELNSQDYLADHQVRESCVFPAAGMVEILSAAARQLAESGTVALNQFVLHGPCLLAADQPLEFETTLRSDRRELHLACRMIDESQWQPLATASISSDIESHWDDQSFERARTTCTQTFAGDDLYEYCQRLGLEYGNAFRGVVRGVRRDGESVAEVVLPNNLTSDEHKYGIHPAILDSCFHAMIAADADYDHTLGGLYLPVQLREIQVLGKASQKVTAHVRLISKTAYRMIADIDVIGDDGKPCLLIRGFESQRVGQQPTHQQQVGELIYQYRWQPADAPEPDVLDAPRRWCLFVGDDPSGSALARRLIEYGDQVTCVQRKSSKSATTTGSVIIDDRDRDEYLRVFSEQRPTDIVYLWGLDAPGNREITAESLQDSTTLTTESLLHLVQAWEQASEADSARLTIVTRDAHSRDQGNDSVDVAQGPLVGFGRVVVSEYGRLKTKLVDLGSEDPTVTALTDEILGWDDEDEIMYRGGGRFVHRFVPQPDQPIPVDACRRLPSKLSIGNITGIEDLHYQTSPVGDLDEEQVELEVIASGLNFSDVMKALGLYPGLPDGRVVLGAECSGRITRVGKNVKDWQIGDEVIAVAPGSFGTHVVVQSDLVAAKPQNLSHAESATIPIAFLTAMYALNECARIRSGESVLIHSASGGVGLAAMQLATIAGATVHATAGNPTKRQHVLAQGAVTAMDSRSLAFAREIMEHTGDDGVDVILNSLPGEAIAKGLSILKTGGRFLEIGKRDIYANAPLGLRPFQNNLSLFAIDLDQLFKTQPSRMGQMLRELIPRFESGELKPLPTATYSVDATREAFRFMQQGKHIGKVAVEYDHRPSQVRVGDYSPIQFREDASYWIAGGLGGFGLEIAQWMAQHGARTLVLSGRRKTVSDQTQKTLDELISRGVDVRIVPADITDPDQVQSVVNLIHDELPPLAGVCHAAMVLEDQLLVNLDLETLQRVLRPKVIGGWNMHHATKDLNLDHFVLFSSLSSVFGHAGQANYSAANAALDSLGHYRRSLGLPATVMNWGHLGEVGYLAEREQLGQRLERQGVLSFSIRQATDALEYALQTQARQVSVLRMDWTVWRGLGITSRVSPRFAHLLRSTTGTGSEQVLSANEIRDADAGQQQTMVGAILSGKAASLLGLDANEIERGRPLLELGLDSLMAVELRNWIENQLEINVPISMLMRGNDLDSLAQDICQMIGQQQSDLTSESESESATPQEISSEQATDLLAELPELSDDDVTDLLTRLLAEEE